MMELLAPAGNINALRSAVISGANAIYIGLENFNARMKADNFNSNNIKEWVDYCHLYGVKLYVTLNISIKQSELDLLDDIIVKCENAGVDAFIITDLSIVDKVKNLAPHVEMHASTQLGVHNHLGAKFIERLGFKRVVLSRECGLEEVRRIKESTSLEVEYFVHGAMCVSFSGGCLLSSIATGNSGNRGRCLQPCRKLYGQNLIDNNQKKYFLSPKDQCLIEYLEKLRMAGVDSLKIEGRMKSSEYVGTVVSAYRKCLDGKSIGREDYKKMRLAYNRGGFNNGYAFSKKKDIMCKNVQGHIGESIGSIINVVKAKDYYKIAIKTVEELSNGDGLKIFRGDIEVGGFEVSIIEKTNKGYLLYSKKCYSVGDKVSKTFSKSLESEYNNLQDKKINIRLNICFDIGNGVKIIGECSGKTITYIENKSFEMSFNNPLSNENVVECFNKTGGTPFVVTDIKVSINGDIFIRKSELNEIRRNAFDYIKNKLLCNEKKVVNCNDFYYNFDLDTKIKKGAIILCNPDIERLKSLDFENYVIVVDYQDFIKNTINYTNFENNIYIKLPKIELSNDLDMLLDGLEKIDINYGVYAENVYALEIAYEKKLKVIGGIGLNIFNEKSVEKFGLKHFVSSPELDYNEMKKIKKNYDFFVYSYGYLPVMSFCHCPIINVLNNDCSKCLYRDFEFFDEYGRYKVEREKYKNCYFTMYNNACHNLSVDSNIFDFNLFLDFSIIKENQNNVINSFLSCKKFDYGVKYTVGHFRKGVN